MTGSNTSFSGLIHNPGRRGFILLATIFLIGQTDVSARADPAPATTLKELYARLDQCMKQSNTSVVSNLTMVFSLKRDGSLLGKPRITHSQLGGDQTQQEAFVRMVLANLARCLPLHLSESLGGAVAGRPLYLHIQNKAPSVAI